VAQGFEMARGEGGRHPSFATRLLPCSAARFCSAFAIASSTNAHRVLLQPFHNMAAPLHNMAIEIECSPDAGMPQALAGDLGMHVARQHVAPVGMAKSKLDDPLPPFLVNGRRLVALRSG
jgi:hypothetical protein